MRARPLFGAIAAAVVAGLLLAGCGDGSTAATESRPTEPAETPATTTSAEDVASPGSTTGTAPHSTEPTVEIILETAPGETVRVDAEIANTTPSRTRGLMDRTELPPDGGMLFVHAETEQHAFWMKNTPLPLDMIFMDENKRVVAVIEQAQPYSTEVLRPEPASRYTLEVNGGFAAEHGVDVGDTAVFDTPPAF